MDTLTRSFSILNNSLTEKQLGQIALLLKLNLIVMIAAALGLVAGIVPQIIKLTNTVGRIEERFQEFADELQPVASAGAGKAVETITNMDAERISETATERAMRFLNKDKKQ